jgi:hypothetical protein
LNLRLGPLGGSGFSWAANEALLLDERDAVLPAWSRTSGPSTLVALRFEKLTRRSRPRPIEVDDVPSGCSFYLVDALLDGPHHVPLLGEDGPIQLRP